MKFRTAARKFFAAALAGTMVLSLAACGGSSGGNSGSAGDTIGLGDSFVGGVQMCF